MKSNKKQFLRYSKPQETQPELVEIEMYGVPVESRTLPAGWIFEPTKTRPQKYCIKYLIRFAEWTR
jgi:hypothetical protein